MASGLNPEARPGPPQVIPRPETAQPGPPSPWSGLPSHRRRRLGLDVVRAALTGPFDPTAARGADPESAVLVPLFEEEGETRVVLTRRAATLRSHRGEVSFPGGRVDPGERLADAALREAAEEIALDPASVEIIGTLSPLTTVSSQARITPFVGLLASRPRLRANPGEVELVFDAALADLVVEGVHHSEHWGRGEVVVHIHFFHLPDDTVWGATARILTDLLSRLLVA